MSTPNNLYLKRKMVSSLTEPNVFDTDTPIQDLVDSLELPPVLYPYLNVTLDGERVPAENWQQVASPKSVVRVTVTPAGGEGKNPLATIAMLALVVYTGGLATGWAAGGMNAYAVAGMQMGILFVGSLVVNAMFPPELPLTTSGMADDSSGFFGVEGMSNKLRSNGAVRSIYGEMKVAPDIAANPYIPSDGDTQTLFMLFDFGYGDIELSDFRIGNTPIGVFDMPKPPVVHRNYTDGPLNVYKNSYFTDTYSVELTATEVTRNTRSDTDQVTLSITFPLGLSWTDKNGDLHEYSVIFQISVENEDGSTGIIPIGSTQYSTSHPVLNSDGERIINTALFEDYYTHTPPPGGLTGTTPGWSVARGGTNFQLAVRDGVLHAGTKLSVFDKSYTITSVTYSHDRTFVAEKRDYVYKVYDVVLSPPVPAESQKILDSWSYVYNAATNTYSKQWVPHSMSGRVRLSSDAFFEFRRATTEAFVFTVTIPLPKPGTWKIHIDRSSPNYDTPVFPGALPTVNRDKTVLNKITSVLYVQALRLLVPHTILELEIIATDQLGGVVDTFTATCRRHIRYWNGTSFTIGFTNNPAWVALDILTGTASPDPLPDSRLDIQSFKDWAVFCDRTPPHSADPDDKMYTVNFTWDAESTVMERLLMVLRAGRATISIRENLYTVIYESFPSVPVQLITPANSWDFTAVKTFTKQPDGLKVQFIDPQANWQMVDRVAYNDGFDETNAEYFENIAEPLCTNSAQAWRSGRYHLAQGKLRPESFSVTMDLENLIAQRGDLVRLQHDVAKMGGTPARVTLIQTPYVTLDQPVLWATSTAPKYFLRMRFDDGTQFEDMVVGQSSSDTIRLGHGAPAKLKVGDLVVYGEVDHVTDEFLVKEVKPAEELTATLDLVPVARDIANSDTGTIPDYVPPIASDDMLIPQEVYPGADITLFYENRFPKVNMEISWSNLGTFVTYEVWMSTEGDYYKKLGTTELNTFMAWEGKSTLDTDYFPGKDVSIKVRAVNSLGYRLPLLACPVLTITSPQDTTPPGKPLFFAGNINKNIMQLNWFPPEDFDIGGYVLKYSNDIESPDWFRGTIEDNLIPYNAMTIDVNARIGAYMLKTIDTSRLESKDFALVRTTIPALDEMNVITVIDEHPAFDGTFSQTVKKGNGVELIKAGGDSTYVSSGTYNFNDIYDVGDVHTCWLSAALKAYGAEDVFISDWDPLSDVDPMAATKEGAWDVMLQVRTASHLSVIADWVEAGLPALPDPKPAPAPAGYGMASIDPIAPTVSADWSGWQQFTAGFYTGEYFQFRAVLASNDQRVSPHVYAMTVQIDMPDRIVSENNLHYVPVPVGHPPTAPPMRVTFPGGAFKVTPTIVITEDNATAEDWLVVTNPTPEGFDIMFKHGSSDSGVEGFFDYLAKGYGKIQPKVLPAIEAGHEDNIELFPGAMAHASRRDLLT